MVDLSFCLSACLSIRLRVYLLICLFVSLPVCLWVYICVSVYLLCVFVDEDTRRGNDTHSPLPTPIFCVLLLSHPRYLFFLPGAVFSLTTVNQSALPCYFFARICPRYTIVLRKDRSKVVYPITYKQVPCSHLPTVLSWWCDSLMEHCTTDSWQMYLLHTMPTSLDSPHFVYSR